MRKHPQVTSGSRFSRLLVLAYEGWKSGHNYWRCECDCGEISVVRAYNLVTGTTKSCGCLSEERKSEYLDRTGEVYGRLTVLRLDAERTSHAKRYMKYWVCQCKCGTVKSLSSAALTTSKTKSCGCIRREATNKARAERPPNPVASLRSRHANMMSRCYNKTCAHYHNYGGRGIKVAPDLHQFVDFLAGFLEKFGSFEIPKGLSLDRIDNDGGLFLG